MKNLIKFITDYRFGVEMFIDTFIIGLNSIAFSCTKTLTKTEMKTLRKFLSNQDISDGEIEFLNPDTSDEGSLSSETNLLIKRVTFKGQRIFIFIFYKDLKFGMFFKEFTLYENNVNEVFNVTNKYFL